MIKDCIVIGGGIIGMMTARELASRGQKVAIFDRGQLGLESSWAAGGILSSMRPWAETPASYSLSEQGKKLYPDYVESLNETTGIDAELVQSGLVIIEKTHIAKTKEWAFANNIKLIDDIQNNISEIHIPEDSILLPKIYQIRPPRLLKALRKSLEQLSVSIYENTEVTDIVVKDAAFHYVECSNNKFYSDKVIVTAGAWSKPLLGKINNEISIKPVHGQMICVKFDRQMLDKMILDGGHYLIPRLDGHVLIGSTMEDTGFTKQTTADARQELMDWAYSTYPKLRVAKFVKHWSGLRPSTDNGKPLIGNIPGYEDIYINSGHFRKGILQAPASAKLLVDHLSGQSSFMDIALFSQPEGNKTVQNVS